MKNPLEKNTIMKYQFLEITLDALKKRGISFYNHYQFCEDMLSNLNFDRDLKNETFKNAIDLEKLQRETH